MRAPEDKDLQQAGSYLRCRSCGCVGPLLRKSVQELCVAGNGRLRVFEFCPGFPQHEDHPPRQQGSSVDWAAEDAKLKGLDLAGAPWLS